MPRKKRKHQRRPASGSPSTRANVLQMCMAKNSSPCHSRKLPILSLSVQIPGVRATHTYSSTSNTRQPTHLLAARNPLDGSVELTQLIIKTAPMRRQNLSPLLQGKVSDRWKAPITRPLSLVAAINSSKYASSLESISTHPCLTNICRRVPSHLLPNLLHKACQASTCFLVRVDLSHNHLPIPYMIQHHVSEYQGRRASGSSHRCSR